MRLLGAVAVLGVGTSSWAGDASPIWLPAAGAASYGSVEIFHQIEVSSDGVPVDQVLITVGGNR
jgi:hypothetical protein